MIRYTPFWNTLRKKELTTYALIHKMGMGSHTVHRLRHNKGISTALIDDLCKLLDCQVEDILEYVPDDKKRQDSSLNS